MNTAKANRTSIAIIMTQPTIIPTKGLLGGLISVVSNFEAVLTVVVEISELSELSVEMPLVGGGVVLGDSEVRVVLGASEGGVVVSVEEFTDDVVKLPVVLKGVSVVVVEIESVEALVNGTAGLVDEVFAKPEVVSFIGGIPSSVVPDPMEVSVSISIISVILNSSPSIISSLVSVILLSDLTGATYTRNKQQPNKPSKQTIEKKYVITMIAT